MSTAGHAFPLDDVRRDTPGVHRVVHLNNAGSSLPPTVVVDTVVRHLQREAAIGGYEAADEARTRIDAVYDSIARLIGARADQIAVVENATRAWDMGVYGYPFRPGHRVLTSRAEYASNVIALLQLRDRFGLEIVLIDDDQHGQVSLDHLERELERGAEMVAITHVPTSGGLVNPAADVGRLCARHGTFYVLDACQSAGQIPLDVGEIGCDLLSATGRKFLRGPRGTGFLFASDRGLERITPPLLDLHAATLVDDDRYDVRADARRFECWEASYACRLGLGAAVDYANQLGLERIWARISELAATLREGLEDLDGVQVHDQGLVRGGIVTFGVEGEPATMVRDRLHAEGINVSVSSASSARLDLGHRGLDDVVRASVHYFNTVDEVDRLVATLAASVRRAR